MALRYSFFKFRTRGIYATPPLPCEPTANCAIHTMLGRRDLPLYLVAIKSWLRFYPMVGVVIHSDGTLTGKHETLLRRHIPGCRFLSADETDARARQVLDADSFLYRCRGFDINFRRLIDTELWCTAPKRIIMDSDILTVQNPVEAIDWIERGDRPIIIGDTQQQKAPIDLSNAHVQALFRARVVELSEGLGWPATFMDGTSAGFYGCKDELPLDKIEKVVKRCMELKLPLEHWGSDQCVVIYLLSIAGAHRLVPQHYFNFWPDDLMRAPSAHIIHFLGTNRFYKNTYTTLATKIVQALLGSPPPCSVVPRDTAMTAVQARAH
jgi:hypothetical protein